MRNRLFLVSIYMFAIDLFGCIRSWSIYYVNWKVAQDNKTAIGNVLKKTKIRNYSKPDVSAATSVSADEPMIVDQPQTAEQLARGATQGQAA